MESFEKKSCCKKTLRFAVYCARGLGDALLSMIVANNLRKEKHEVTIYSDALNGLQNFFSDIIIRPWLSENLNPAELKREFSPYDRIVSADYTPILDRLKGEEKLLVFEEKNFDKTKSMVENLMICCKKNLSISHVTKETGICIPKKFSYRSCSKRVIIHPTSMDQKKNWPQKKFFLLAKKLQREGFQVTFILSPSERKDRTWMQCEGVSIPLFSSMEDLCTYVFESAYMIGNDSGIGHLSSLLKIPTLSIFSRKSYSKLWRPGWGGGDVVVPTMFFPGARLKQKYWKKMLSVRKVFRAFLHLRDKYS